MLRTLLILALCIASTSAPAQSREPVKLGLIDIYSGGFAFIADSIRTGFQIAVDEANAAGGLNGRQFEVVTADMGGEKIALAGEHGQTLLVQSSRSPHLAEPPPGYGASR